MIPSQKSDKTAVFIEKSVKIHGTKYDYSKSIYIRAEDRLEIVCSKHGSFFQRPIEHLRGRGCQKCGQESRSINIKTTAKMKSADIGKAFIERCTDLHQGLYDYSKVKYTNNRNKIEIICKEHGSFWMRPNNHLSDKQGCPQCKLTGVRQRNLATRDRVGETFVDELRKAHEVRGLYYNYDKVVYKGAKSIITVACSIHGDFNGRASAIRYQGLGCPKCAGRYRTIPELLEAFRGAHGDRWNYDKVDTTLTNELITIGCSRHGEFQQKVAIHLYAQSGCPKCKVVVSKAHRAVINLLVALGYEEDKDFVVNDRATLLNPISNKFLELDIYFSHKRVAIEIDGIYYHGKHKNSSKIIDVDAMLRRDAHKDQLCLDARIKLLRIDDVDVYKLSPLIESRLLELLNKN